MTNVACGMGIDNVQTVTDTDAPVTREDILQSLRDMVAQAEPGDTLMFSFSGHGGQVADRNGDEADGQDEAIYAADGPITDDEIRAIMADLPEGANMTMVYDSCQSGTIVDLDFSDADIAGNLVVLSSCSSTELSGATANGSLFTNAIAEVLANNPGITWAEAANLIDQADGSDTQFANVAANRTELLYEPAFAPAEDAARDASAEVGDIGSAVAVEIIDGNEVHIERFQGGAEIRSVDTDGDGTANVIAYTSADGSVQLEGDVTGDGSQDAAARFDADGNLTMAAYDADGDGYYETQLHANDDGSVTVGVYDRNGNLTQNLDQDGDGLVDANTDVNGDGSADLPAGFDLTGLALDGIHATGAELGGMDHGDMCC
ncbi:hypothetical protein H9P43_000679 [Blastocladiella emersonii ATCC 22665]|nr:hypothetical protein H9P43_000649 [Blastocladiella emersonii ATCC 22665]KAI9189248.1 hypothetical protein H9P43_000679 [Blastocladiella emersonii ATCC 22665]